MILGLGILSIPSCSQTEAPSEDPIQDEFFDIQRGTNISHWLSQSSKRGEERSQYFLEEDVAFLANVGFDHLRIPIDEEQMWNEQGEKEEEVFKLLHDAIGWSQKHKLKVIVDLHILRSHHFNRGEKPLWTEASAQEQFFDCWRDLSEELNQYPNDFLAYELMNEPVADNPEDWNKLVAKAVAVVRKLEAKRKILIGSNRWQSTETFDDLKLPENDPNIIVSFHFYEPFLITHHQTSWTQIKDYKGEVVYPGQPISEAILDTLSKDIKDIVGPMNQVFDKKSLEERIIKPINFAKERGLQVYCGEWGCYPSVGRTSFLHWYRDVKSIMESHGVAWTTWDYKGGFGIQKDGEAVTDLIEVLVSN